MKKNRVIAFHLPQFYPFKENDEWWGKGFTEWTNVTKAKPRFKGHYQPHLPTDIGFYDLRVPEVRAEQAEMARKYGIYGFCYYHYWFSGKPLMERPLEEILNSGEPDFPFMLCWANHNWTRKWDGSINSVLIEQIYSKEDDVKHIRYLLPFLKDPRYIRINGKPLITILSTPSMPNADNTIRLWREEARKSGIDLYVCRTEVSKEIGKEYSTSEVDAAIEFSPHMSRGYSLPKTYKPIKRIINKFYRKFFNKNLFMMPALKYLDYVNFQEKRIFPKEYKYYPSVTPSWDNTARCKSDAHPLIWDGSTPELFEKWLRSVIEKFNPYSDEENLIFINAWNEWAEGNHLEPDIKWGYGYLEAVKRVLEVYQ